MLSCFYYNMRKGASAPACRVAGRGSLTLQIHSSLWILRLYIILYIYYAEFMYV